MHLQMMCLGRNWDPDRSEYVEIRPIDGAKAPILPNEFHLLVKKAIKDSHALIERDSNESHVEDFLPFMSPNICVVNFYKESGRLGLHQVCHENFIILIVGVVCFHMVESCSTGTAPFFVILSFICVALCIPLHNYDLGFYDI